MKKLITIFLLLLLPSIVSASDEVTWAQLAELDSDPAKAKQVPESLAKILEKSVTVKGFMMPLDYSQKKISEFLLMPYVPSCIHVPPPPANQLILVKMGAGKEVEPSFYPVELLGKVEIKPSSEFESSYEMIGETMKELKE
jgi:uncharacterized protein